MRLTGAMGCSSGHIRPQQHPAASLLCRILWPSCRNQLRRSPLWETGIDIVKSLRPLLITLGGPSSGNALNDLRAERQRLSARVGEVIHEFGSETFHELEEDPDMAGVSDHPSKELESRGEDQRSSHYPDGSVSTSAHRQPDCGSSGNRTRFAKSA
jgi:hypothetical protein